MMTVGDDHDQQQQQNNPLRQSPDDPDASLYSQSSQGPKSPSLQPQHRRGYQACDPCRKRKVKCDLGSKSYRWRIMPFLQAFFLYPGLSQS